MADEYSDGTYLWWHLSGPSPELVDALQDGWLGTPGVALDAGCGLGTEAAHLQRSGWSVIGVDRSLRALMRAHRRDGGPFYVRADLRELPIRSQAFDACLDRGCFHYLAPADRTRYEAQLRRVLRPGSPLLLRASLRSAGVRNDIDEEVIVNTFERWQVVSMVRTAVPSDTRQLEVLLVRLRAPVQQ
jgi:SAM-dependent methyltransferase